MQKVNDQVYEEQPSAVPSGTVSEDNFLKAAQWQPASTIPRNGQVVLMSNGRLIQVGSFMPADAADRYVLYFAIPMGDSYGALNVRSDSGFIPTHWMPLPDPPSLNAPERNTES